MTAFDDDVVLVTGKDSGGGVAIPGRFVDHIVGRLRRTEGQQVRPSLGDWPC
jgi:hypothetical protein